MGVKVIKFGAVWCSPCHTLERVVKNIEPKVPTAEFLYYDIDINTDECVKHNITQVPTLLILKNDVEKERINYVISESELKRKIDNVI